MSAAVQHDRAPLQVARRQVVVFGLARSGRAAAELLHAHGAHVVGVDESDTGFDNAWTKQFLAAQHRRADEALLTDAALLVLSPGIPRSHPLVRAATARGLPVLSEIEVAYRFSRSPVIAITGTKGKSTTTALTGHLLDAVGVAHRVAGNIGRPYASVVGELSPEAWAVLEISSFQLESIASFHARVAVQLQITPDHLDRYASFEAYAESKARIAQHQVAGDVLVVNPRDPWGRRLAARSSARVVGFGVPWKGCGTSREGDALVWHDGAERQTLAHVDDVALLGSHNLQNCLAALAIVRCLDLWNETARRALGDFEGLEFRMQDCGSVAGVRFVNDAKSTTVDSVRAAVEGLPGPLLLALGGRNKGLDFGPLRDALVSVRRLLVFGEAAPELAARLGDVCPTEQVADVEAVVQRALQVGRPGDTLLFSPGCTSFDAFRDAEERGRAFGEAVRAARSSARS